MDSDDKFIIHMLMEKEANVIADEQEHLVVLTSLLQI